MSNVIEKPARRAAKPKLSLRALQAELTALNERVEDLEDSHRTLRHGARAVTFRPRLRRM